MSTEAIQRAMTLWRTSDLSSTEKLVLMAIAQRVHPSSQDHHTASMPLVNIATACGISLSALRRALNQLQYSQVIECKKIQGSFRSEFRVPITKTYPSQKQEISYDP